MPVRIRREKRRNQSLPSFAGIGAVVLGLASLLAMSAAAQLPESDQDTGGVRNGEKPVRDCRNSILAPTEHGVHGNYANDDHEGGCRKPPAPSANLDPNAIMGFESLGTWIVRGDGLLSGFAVQSTATRTQGAAAFSVADPPNRMTLISRPVASTATALTGIGNKGAMLQLDVMIPADGKDVDRNKKDDDDDDGWIDAFVSSRSRDLHKVPLGHVFLGRYRTGIYNTIGFSVPGHVSSALDGATYSDLVFELEVSSPHRLRGAFLFDNLRVHSVDLVQSPNGTPPPPGYGGSINLDVPGDAPVSLSFDLGPVQIPEGFHLKKGDVGATTVELQLGLDSKPSLTCTYDVDGSDSSGRSYTLKSCTGSYKAGDLVNANWVSLGITGGDATQEILAQLALNPMGDLAGSGILPPMPTFWGDSDACTPAPVPGTVVTTSASCSGQASQASQIVTDYFNQVKNAHPSTNWIAAPVPDSAQRHADGTPTDNLTGTPISDAVSRRLARRQVPAGDPPFDTGGDLNPGGSFDAYWRLSGNLTPTAVTGTDENLTHFDATFTAHGVLFGDDIDVVDAKLTADTDSGETTPTFKPATSTGTLGFYVFGEEIPSGGLTFSPSTGFSVDPSWSQEYNLPSIQIWIFDITLGATVEADLNAQGSAALSGADLSVTPSASIGGHVSGGINLGIASGNVDAKVNLVTLSAPMTAQVKWVLNTNPEICAATLNGSLTGNLNLGSGGGEVDLDATFGICPFCYTDSYTLIKWASLVNKKWTLFDDTIDTQLFGLPSSLCTYPITVAISSPAQNATLSSGLPITLSGSAAPNDNTLPFTATYTWTFTPGANASTATVQSGANTAHPVVLFGAPTSGNTSTWTIGMSATTTVEGAGGTMIKQTGTATPVTVTVTNLSKGVYIAQVVSATNGVAVLDGSGALDVGNVPMPITVSGIVSGATGTLNSTFSVAPCNDGTAACTSPGAAVALPVTGAATATPSAVWTTGFDGGYYKITMNTTAAGSQFGAASTVIFGTILF